MILEVSVCKTLKSEGRRFDLDVQFSSSASIMVIFGPSGSGKTLTIQAIAGLIKPDSGRIALNDRILFNSRDGINLMARERKVGFLFQDYALFPHLSVAENVGFRCLVLRWAIWTTMPHDEWKSSSPHLNLPRWRTIFRGNFPADSVSGSRWRGH